MTSPRLVSVQVGRPREMGVEGAGDPLDRPWTSAIFKASITRPVHLGLTNLEGDAQADLKHHGGPDMAVLVYSADHYAAWRDEYPDLELSHGAFGENFTLTGYDEGTACLGDTLAVGEAQVQVSQPRIPCWKIGRRLRRPEVLSRVVQTGRTGWYLRVLTEGLVSADVAITLLERPCPEWTITRVAQVMHKPLEDREAARALSECPFLSAEWRQRLAAKLSVEA